MIAFQLQHDENFDTNVALVARFGFREVSMGFGSSKVFHTDGWETEIQRVDMLLKDHHLTCVQTHTPYYHPLISAEDMDPVMETALARCIIANRMLGAELCAIHPRSAVNDNYDVEKSILYTRKSIDALVPIAEQEKVTICLENLMKWPQWPLYPHKAEDLLALVEMYNSPYVAATWDFGHAHMTVGIDEIAAVHTLGNHLRATHIHDNIKANVSDSHLPPFDGDNDWEKLMAAMAAIDYQGPLTTEVDIPTDYTAEEIVRKCYNGLNTLHALIEKNRYKLY